MSDVPLGAMLSGGIDSSVIVALMARHMTEPVKTFSVGFAEAGEGNELADARLVAEHFGTDHHELELSFAEQTVDLSELVWHMDEPLADLSALGFLALSELAASTSRSRCPVRAPTSSSAATASIERPRSRATWTRLPGPLARRRRAALRRAPAEPGRASRTLAASDPAERLLADERKARRRSPTSARSRGRSPRSTAGGAETIRERLGGVGDDPLPAALYLDAQLGLVDDMLHYFDRASMAHSLEVRVPSSTITWSSSAPRIPPRHKVRRLDTKHVLKRAARGLVPDSIIDKPKIGFFHTVVDGWFRAQTRGAISDYLLGPEPTVRRDARPGRCRAARQGALGRDRQPERPSASLDPDARGLALVLPAPVARCARGSAREVAVR